MMTREQERERRALEAELLAACRAELPGLTWLLTKHAGIVALVPGGVIRVLDVKEYAEGHTVGKVVEALRSYLRDDAARLRREADAIDALLDGGKGDTTREGA